MSKNRSEPEVVEPEVLPPEEKSRGRRSTGEPWNRAERMFGPVVAGLILDFADLATFGPMGMLIGSVVGYWIASVFRMPAGQRVVMALAAGLYCILPFTHFLPVATLMGTMVRLREATQRR